MTAEITSEQQEGVIHQAQLHATETNETFPETFTLELRGKRFHVTRQTLFSLPESIVYSLSSGFTFGEPVSTSQTNAGEEITIVDFSPEYFDYALTAFENATKDLDPKTMPVSAFSEFSGYEAVSGMEEQRGDLGGAEPKFLMNPEKVPEILTKRPSIVVLKEDIEYYCVSEDTNLDAESLRKVKIRAGEVLSSEKQIFHGFDVEPQEDDGLGNPEYHLVRMLCLSGYSPSDTWGYREREPHKTVVSSLQLTPLKLPESDQDTEAVQAIQKLLMFWKKPARKCWWHKFELNEEGVKPATVHVRRVWTLELSVLGVDS